MVRRPRAKAGLALAGVAVLVLAGLVALALRVGAPWGGPSPRAGGPGQMEGALQVEAGAAGSARGAGRLGAGLVEGAAAPASAATASGAAVGAGAGGAGGARPGGAAGTGAGLAEGVPTAKGGYPGPPSGQVAHPNAFFSAVLFYEGLAASLAREDEVVQVGSWGAPGSTGVQSGGLVQPWPVGPLAGGLVPHHDLAAELLSSFFIRLEEQPPELILLVGPNHESLGQPVSTGRRSWQTDFGLVEVDQGTVTALVEAGLAVVDEQVFTREHSVGVLMPYIKYHAPGARVVPLVLHRDMTLAQLQRLALGLVRHLGPDRILVASVDFSHYLTRQEAEAKDLVTLQAVQTRDLATLMQMGPDHLDSPGSLAVLLQAMEEAGAEGPVVTGHTNAGVILRDDLIETTSYFTFAFTRP